MLSIGNNKIKQIHIVVIYNYAVSGSNVTCIIHYRNKITLKKNDHVI